MRSFRFQRSKRARQRRIHGLDPERLAKSSAAGVGAARYESVGFKKRALAILEVMTGPHHRGPAGVHTGGSRQALWSPGLEVLEPGGERGDLSGLAVDQSLADGLEAGIRRDDLTQPTPIRGGTRLKLAERLR